MDETVSVRDLHSEVVEDVYGDELHLRWYSASGRAEFSLFTKDGVAGEQGHWWGPTVILDDRGVTALEQALKRFRALQAKGGGR